MAKLGACGLAGLQANVATRCLKVDREQARSYGCARCFCRSQLAGDPGLKANGATRCLELFASKLARLRVCGVFL